MVGTVQLTGLQAEKLTGQFTIVGASTSEMVTSKEQVAVLPAASVTTKVLVVVPTGKVDPLGRPAVRTTL